MGLSRMMEISIIIVLTLVSTNVGANASACRRRISAKDPSQRISKPSFGELYVIPQQETASALQKSCTWEFSSPSDMLLSLHFVNYTSSTSSYNCSDCFAVIKKSSFENNAVERFVWYCGQSPPPGIRINGTVEIELHCNGNKSNDSSVSMAVLIEATTAHCGGVFNNHYHAYPLSFNASRYTANQFVHCVWYFDFIEELEMNILVSQFTVPHEFYVRCRQGFLEIRAWDEKGHVTYTKRECKTQDYKLPTSFVSSTSKHFAVTIHSAQSTRNNETVSALCFPTTKGYFASYLRIDNIVQKHIETFQPPVQPRSKVNGLLFLKAKQRQDQLFAVLRNISNLCDHGAVQIWSDFTSVFKSNATFCQKNGIAPILEANSQSSFIIYYQAAAATSQVFHITLFASNKGCGKIYQLAHGQANLVKSPVDPNQRGRYPKNANCRWFFVSNNETEFDIEVKEMHLEKCGQDLCTCDALKITELKSTSLSYVLCEKPSIDYLVRGDMVLHFKSDASGQYTGFLVNISAWKVCGEEFYMLPGDVIELESPRYGLRPYPSNYLCQWNILTTGGTVLNISVIDMDLDPLGCSHYYFDYVEVFKGVYQNITLVHNICEKPSANIIMNGSSTVRFHSDASLEGRGFQMVVRANPVFTSTTTESPSTAKTSSTNGKPSSSRNLNSTAGAPISKSKTHPTTLPLQSSTKCCVKSSKVSVYSISTSTNKDVNQTAKRLSSGEKLYVIGIVLPIVVIVCGAIAAAVYLRRVHFRAPKQKTEQGGREEDSRWRKRQGSTVPLVDMDVHRKSSCPENSLPCIIENGCYSISTPNQLTLESDNAYYSSNNCVVNPYYDNGKGENAEYACIDANEEQLYSEIQGKKDEIDYTIVGNVEHQMNSDGPHHAEDNHYAFIGDDKIF